jgi:hypothetical protein
METSKIQAIQGNGTWQNQHGETMYSWALELEDGTTGKANTKTPEPWYQVGTEVAYAVRSEHPTHGKTLKIDRLNMVGYQGGSRGNGGGKSSPEITRRILSCWAISEALRLMQAEASNGQPSADLTSSGSTLREVKNRATSLLALRKELAEQIEADT